MTQNEYKIGDRVRHLGYNLCGIITDFLGEGFVKVRAIDDDVFSTWDINNLELCDRKTAFLTRLQSLLKEFDARIYDNDYYRVYIDLGIHDSLNPMERIVYTDTEGEITADNIMDFDKE